MRSAAPSISVRKLVGERRPTERPGFAHALRKSCCTGRRRSWSTPGDEIAADVRGDSHPIWPRSPIASRCSARLGVAFVQGRLTKDEFDLSGSARRLPPGAELDALTADIPAGPIETRPPAPDRESHNRKVIQRGTAAGAGASMAFTAAMVMVAGGDPVVGAVAVPLVGLFVAVLLAGLLDASFMGP